MRPITASTSVPTIEEALQQLTKTALPKRADVAGYFASLARTTGEFLFRAEQLSAPRDSTRRTFVGEVAQLCARNPERAARMFRTAYDDIRDSQISLGISIVAGESAGIIGKPEATAMTDILREAVGVVGRMQQRPIPATEEMAALLSRARTAATTLLGIANPREMPAMPLTKPTQSKETPARMGGTPHYLRVEEELRAVTLPPELAIPLNQFLVSCAASKTPVHEFYAKLAFAADRYVALTQQLAPEVGAAGQTWSKNVIELSRHTPAVARRLIEDMQSEMRIGAITLLAHLTEGCARDIFDTPASRRLENTVQKLGVAVEVMRSDPAGAMDRVRELLSLLREECEGILCTEPKRPPRPQPVAVVPAAKPVVAPSAPPPAPREDATPFEPTGDRPHSAPVVTAVGPSAVNEYLRDEFRFTAGTLKSVEQRIISHAVKDDDLLKIEGALAPLPRPVLRGLVERDPKLFPVTLEAAGDLVQRYSETAALYETRGIHQRDVTAMLTADPRLIFKETGAHRRHADVLRQLKVVRASGGAPMTGEQITGAQLLPATINATLRQEKGRKKQKA